MDQCVSGTMPGLGLVVAGQLGTGRTVLCLQVAEAALARGERVALLSAEPPPGLLHQAGSLGLDLSAGVETGRLVLLEMVDGVSSVVRAYGLAPLVDSLWDEVPDADLWILDPLTALTQDLIDEKPLREGVMALLGESESRRPVTVVASVDSVHLTRQPALERAISDVCGALLHLGRDEDGDRSLSVLKTRVGGGGSGRVPFAIASGGLHALAVSELAPKPEPRASEVALEGVVPGEGARSAESSAEGPGEAEAETDARRTVLLVGQDDAHRSQLRRALDDTYLVLEACDGFSALGAVLSQLPDVVILDLFLSDVSGYEVLRVLQRSPHAPPVLAISDRLLRAADRIRALVLGATEVLPKSCATLEVRLKIEALLRMPQPRLSDLGVDTDPGDVVLLVESRKRSVDEPEFRTRIQRAHRFGDRFGVASSAVAIEASSEPELDRVLAACEALLRAEDCVYALNETRALILLVASGPDHAPLVMNRLGQKIQGEPALSWGARTVTSEVLHADWEKYFEEIERR